MEAVRDQLYCVRSRKRLEQACVAVSRYAPGLAAIRYPKTSMTSGPNSLRKCGAPSIRMAQVNSHKARLTTL
jgi:hypothetical protein